MQLDFRDGTREVPEHLASVLLPYQARLYQITYDEACAFANQVMLNDLVERRFESIISDHFKLNRDR